MNELFHALCFRFLPFSNCSVVNLRLLALEMLFLSAASRLQKQNRNKFPSWLQGVVMEGHEVVRRVVAAPWVRPWALFFKEHPSEPQLFATFNPPSPHVSWSHSADSRLTALLTLVLSSTYCTMYCAACSHLCTSVPPFPDAIFFLSDLSSRCHHKVFYRY